MDRDWINARAQAPAQADSTYLIGTTYFPGKNQGPSYGVLFTHGDQINGPDSPAYKSVAFVSGEAAATLFDIPQALQKRFDLGETAKVTYIPGNDGDRQDRLQLHNGCQPELSQFAGHGVTITLHIDEIASAERVLEPA